MIGNYINFTAMQHPSVAQRQAERLASVLLYTVTARTRKKKRKRRLKRSNSERKVLSSRSALRLSKHLPPPPSPALCGPFPQVFCKGANLFYPGDAIIPPNTATPHPASATHRRKGEDAEEGRGCHGKLSHEGRVVGAAVTPPATITDGTRALQRPPAGLQ